MNPNSAKISILDLLWKKTEIRYFPSNFLEDYYYIRSLMVCAAIMLDGSWSLPPLCFEMQCLLAWGVEIFFVILGSASYGCSWAWFHFNVHQCVASKSSPDQKISVHLMDWPDRSLILNPIDHGDLQWSIGNNFSLLRVPKVRKTALEKVWG